MAVIDPNLLFWPLALANFLGVVVCALLGVRRIRRRDLRGHRRFMIGAGGLVGLFLLSYVLKVIFLGKELRELWTATARTALYVHETAILVMLVAGGVAGYRAWRFRHTLGSGPLPDPVEESRRGRLWHRRAGWTAVVASMGAFVTAAVWLSARFASMAP